MKEAKSTIDELDNVTAIIQVNDKVLSEKKQELESKNKAIKESITKLSDLTAQLKKLGEAKEITKEKMIKGWCDETPAPKGAIIRKKERPIINPEYDEDVKYVIRVDRPEWNIVGLVGQVAIIKGSPVAPNWFKIKNLSEKMEKWLIK